jgi:glycosyltransferase involved in cell wall biosynthesis
MKNFSVLMSVYAKTDLIHFQECLDSINNQTLLPSEVVLIKDGPLNYNINEIISRYSKLKIILVVNKVNLGLPKSLNIGLQKCSHEIVFRMDSDDVCHKERFNIQFDKINSNERLVVLGTNVELIDQDSNEISKIRNVPTTDADIREIINLKNPFNHPTVVFRKSIILSVGGYSDVYLYEDWYLWFKLSALKNVEFENMTDKLLKYRIRTFNERTGFNTIKAEFNFYFLLFKNKYINWNVFLSNITIKFFVRILPMRFYNMFKHRFDKIGSK